MDRGASIPPSSNGSSVFQPDGSPLYVYGPDGRMGYWGMVWDTAQDMRSTLCQNMGGGVPIEVIDKLVSLSARIAPKQD
jgi:hypothetical protein